MICTSCNSQANRIIVKAGREYCPACSSIKETGGTKVDGLLTRNSFRVREQSVMHESDFTVPHVYNKMTRQYEPNVDFIRQFPVMAHKHYNADELASVGYDKLAKQVDKNNLIEEINHAVMQETEGVGDEREALREVIES